jgi:hypothetical protein
MAASPMGRSTPDDSRIQNSKSLLDLALILTADISFQAQIRIEMITVAQV